MARIARGFLLSALLLVLGGCRRDPPPQVRLCETGLEGVRGVALPGGTFLCLETWERDAFTSAPGAPEASVERYRGIVLQGLEAEAPPEILDHRKLAATARLLLCDPAGAGSLPLVPDLFRYDYAVCQGLLRQAREGLFEGAGCDREGRVVCLPLWSSGAAVADEEWALLYLENGALTTVPRRTVPARSLAAPLAAASVMAPRPDRRLAVKLAPDGRAAAALGRTGEMEVVALGGPPLPPVSRRGWECAWHPRTGQLYLTSERGLELLDPESGAARTLPLALPKGAKPRAVEPCPTGEFLVVIPAGGQAALWSVPLDSGGAPVGTVRPLPAEAASSPLRVWEPGGTLLWCFDPPSGRAFRVDAATGRMAGRWSWDTARAALYAEQTGPDLPTVTLRYAAPGFPAWQRFTAWLDVKTLRFIGVSQEPPVKKIEWARDGRDGIGVTE